MLHPMRITYTWAILSSAVFLSGPSPAIALKLSTPLHMDHPIPCVYIEAAACVGGACYSPESVTACSEPVPACKQYIPRVEKFAVLLQNTNYRLGDIVQQAGVNWRSSMLAILSSPVFRGTMMRNVSSCSVSLAGGKLCEIANGDYDLEEKVRLESRNEGGDGYFCNLGTNNPSAMSVGEVPHHSIMDWVKDKHDRGECGEAASDELIVQIRMGDVFEPIHVIVDNVDHALTVKPFVKTVVFSGVLHFSGFRGAFDGTATLDDDRVKQNLQYIDELRTRYADRGFNVRMRSEPLADYDLCYLAYVPNLLQSCAHAGWCDIISRLRRDIEDDRFHELPQKSDWILF
jgi:hypothetical protein